MPSTSTEEPVQSQAPPQNLTFVYRGVQYDASGYAEKHPGGDSIIKNMATQRKDFTQYFKSLHSTTAEKILRSLPVVSTVEESTPSKEYFELLEKLKHLFEPTYWKDAVLITFVSSLFLYGCFGSNWILCILAFGISQIITGWIAHSMHHSRHPIVRSIGLIISPLVAGLTDSWWSPKHNAHHMFTNSLLYDDDIKHEYKVYLYPFLYLKWRFDSFVSSVSGRHYNQLALMIVNYWFLSFSNLWLFVIGQLIGGFYSAFVLIGNHQRQHKFPSTVKMTFIDHQIITCRNYKKFGLFWLLMMGGMQYQTEHHLFPQILFYNLPQAARIIKQELAKVNKQLIYGPVI